MARPQTNREFYAGLGPPAAWGEREWLLHSARRAARLKAEREAREAREARKERAPRLLRQAAAAFREAGERRNNAKASAWRAGVAWREATADALDERHVQVMRGGRVSGQLRRLNRQILAQRG